MPGTRRGPEESWNTMVTEPTRAVLGEFTANGGSDTLFIQPVCAWQCAGGHARSVEEKALLWGSLKPHEAERHLRPRQKLGNKAEPS